MDINYELYKVFYYVATSLSFSEASKKLFISQSAVSQSIKTLEKKLGQTLFIRSTKKVQLTAAGALLLKHIEPAMNLIARGESQLLDSGTLGLGQLHIGRKRYHMPLSAGSLLKAVPSEVSECAYQGHKCHIYPVCGAFGAKKG